MNPSNLFFTTASLIAASTLSGCTTVGQGSGYVETDKSQADSVAFNWKSPNEGQSGTISARLPDGDTFSGPFFQINSQTEIDDIEPLWSGWDYGWYGWNYWGGNAYQTTVPVVDFVTRYSGKLVANLVSPSGGRMRCRFHLAEPYRGMEGGGDGECQLQGQEQIHAYFPAQ